MKNLLFFFIIGATFAACERKTSASSTENNPFPQGKWIDLTYTIDSTTLYWPNNATGFEHIVDFQGITPKGFYYTSYKMCTPEHGGTHIDAPIHFAEGKWTVDEIPLSQTTGEGVVIDVSQKALQNRDYQITSEDILNWENEHGKIPTDAIVFFKTGYGKFYPNRKEYFGTDLKGEAAIPQLHFPGIAPEAAQWIVDHRKIKAFGLDVASMDYGQSTDFKTHQIMLGHQIPGFENVAHLDQLPTKGFYVVALPMKIGKGSGAPLRLAAFIKS